MQSSDRLLAQRYAKALFDAAGDKKQGDAVRQELSDAARKLRDHVKTFQHPLVPIEDKQKAHRRIVGQESKLVARFLDLLIEKKRWSLLPLVAACYDRISDEAHGIARAQVRSARPLSDAERDKLRQGLEKFAGKKVQLDVKDDPSLIGGAVVKMGDWVLDASLANRLHRMRDLMAGTEN